MTDDLTLKEQRDRTRINTREEHEIRYWTERFGCTRDQLLTAVKDVGSSASAVRQALGR